MASPNKPYQGWWIFATAVAVVLFQNVVVFFRQPDLAFVQWIWALAQGGQGWEKWIAGIARDRGLSAAWWASALAPLVLQLLLALVAALIFWFICRRANALKLWRMSWIACAILTLFSGSVFAWQLPGLLEARRQDPRILLPRDLAAWAEQREGLLFANPSALPVLEPLADGARFLPIGEAKAVIAEPLKWRQLDQEKSFGAVILLGRPGEYAPLLRHLLDSPEWALAYADNFGIGFRRGQQLWQPPAPDQAAGKFAHPRAAAGYLSQTALILSALGRNGDAIRYFEAAEKIAPNEPETYARKAVFLNSRDRFGDAVAAADQALALNPGMLAALQIKALALLSANQTEAAWKTALRLPELAPQDPYSLFIYARCANAARAFSAETDALEKVIALSEKQGQPTANYRIFLAQSYARRGLSDQALAQFRKAALEPGNSPAQKKEIEQSIANIEAQIGGSGR